MAIPPTRELKGDHCQCRACFEYFNSTRAFDMHRRGKHGIPGTRHCLTVEEMLKKGMCKNAGGWWIREKMDAGATALRIGAV
jgi:hypothetical protein